MGLGLPACQDWVVRGGKWCLSSTSLKSCGSNFMFTGWLIMTKGKEPQTCRILNAVHTKYTDPAPTNIHAVVHWSTQSWQPRIFIRMLYQFKAGSLKTIWWLVCPWFPKWPSALGVQQITKFTVQIVTWFWVTDKTTFQIRGKEKKVWIGLNYLKHVLCFDLSLLSP